LEPPLGSNHKVTEKIGIGGDIYIALDFRSKPVSNKFAHYFTRRAPADLNLIKGLNRRQSRSATGSTGRAPPPFLANFGRVSAHDSTGFKALPNS
jgi:hypothetical protein